MLKTRVLTALILLLIVLIILLFTSIIVFELFGLTLVAVAAWEWARLANLTTLKERLVYMIVVVVVCLIAWQIPPAWILTAAMIGWLCASCLVLCYPHASEFWGQNRWLKASMGILVLTFFWIGLSVIRHYPRGIAHLLLALCIIWAADTGAYFVGRRWGKHKLAPVVSPGKTWEGLLGGLVLSLLVAWIGGFWLGISPRYWLWGSLWVVLTVIASLFGDLFESMVKRQAGVKDSGKLLPGHGGLLDRIDSLTAGLPIFALGLLLIS
ncbi:MAG: phosphatidate cytidylyltransferase [Gammaproteobacteria bacterium]